MSDERRPDSDEDLLEVDRELSPEEQGRLARIGRISWHQLLQMLVSRARTTYSVSEPEQFTICVREHLSHDQRADMVNADVYTCPQCSNLLKDRQTPVASGILLERMRLRELWLDVEQAPTSDFDVRFDRFRRALGLQQ